MVAVKLRPIDVDAGRYRAFDRVKRLLSFLTSDALQPFNSCLFVRRPFCQCKAIRNSDERSGSSWMTDPAKILFLFQIRFQKLAGRPISHRAESHFALDEELDRLIPSQCGMIGIYIIQHLGEKPHGRLHTRVIPLNRAEEEIPPILRTKHPQQRIFEQLRRRPDTGITDSQRSNSGLLKLIAIRKKLIERHLIAYLDPVLLQQSRVIPQNVSAMNSGENRVDFAIFGHQIDNHFLWESVVPAVAFVEFGYRLAKPGIHILAKQLVTRMALPG